MSQPIENFFVTVQGHRLEAQRIVGAAEHRPTIVFLHEGLGSISTWRDFPQEVVASTGCSAIVYSRYGYGQSDVLREDRSVTYLHDEALCALPELLQKVGIENPILLGHSDGASIALIYAGAGNRALALILLAPHVFVEDITVANIAETKAAFENTDLADKLARHHRDAAATFWGWNRVWLSQEFRSWNIEGFLPRITSSVLAIQGLEDQYGTIAQLDAIQRQVRGPFERLELANCRHSPHRDQPSQIVGTIRDFWGRLEP